MPGVVYCRAVFMHFFFGLSPERAVLNTENILPIHKSIRIILTTLYPILKKNPIHFFHRDLLQIWLYFLPHTKIKVIHTQHPLQINVISKYAILT